MPKPSILRALRLEREMTLEEVSKSVGMSLTGYRQVEMGLRTVRTVQAERIANFFEWPLSDLFLPESWSVRENPRACLTD